jgi:branched-subunit amino acid aminotransferase/4-amino-4-deoxychorismate lyase
MLLLNNALLPTAALSLPNRGLAFGDGFFETFIWADNRLRLAADHHARMQRAAAALYLTLPAPLVSAGALEATLGRLVAAHNLSAARLRLQLWRAGAGLYTPETDSTEWLATAAPFVANETPVVKADFALENHSICSPLSFCKGPQAWLYVRAAHERRRRGLDEIILCDTAGYVAEAGAAAIFWMKDGVLFTPSPDTGCVAGVRRAEVLRRARTARVTCREGMFGQEVLLAAGSVFTANVAAIRPVLSCSGQRFATELPAWIQNV